MYGIREHAMGAIMNGLALHGGVIPYGGTFFVFSDYVRPSIRLAALMGLRVVYVLTHDSIGVGEDGPTHQPVEHLASYRAMPNVLMFRPCDVVETAEAWQLALTTETMPSLLALSRQNLPLLRVSSRQNLTAKGGYVISDVAKGSRRQATIIATGSEVSIAVEAQKKPQQGSRPCAADRGRSCRQIRLGEVSRQQGRNHRHGRIRRFRSGVRAL